MKICAYCTTKNRDEAIFCTRCKRALPVVQSPKKFSLIWLLIGFVLIGLSTYLFSVGSFLAPTPVGTPLLKGMPTAGSAATRRREPLTLLTCVTDTTRIRRGPGTHYETIGGLSSGTCLTILGRNEDASWVFMVSNDHQAGWVAVSLLSDAPDLSRVSVRDDSAMINPARPTLTSAELAYGAELYLTKIAATNLPQWPLSQYVVPCFETANRIGDNVSCRIEKAYCDYFPLVEGSPTFCSDRPPPDHTFTLLVRGEDWSEYDGQCLIVSGYLEIERGALQIQALRRSQVSSCN